MQTHPPCPRRLAVAAMLMVLSACPVPVLADDPPAPRRDARSAAEAGGKAVVSPIKGETKVLSVKRSGSLVKKGDLICGLDSFRLKEELAMIQIEWNRARADYLNAKLTREVAEIAIKEDEAVGSGDLARKLSEVALAKTELSLAMQIAQEAKAEPERKKAEEGVARGQKRLEEVQADLVQFKTVLLPRRVKERQASLEKAKVDEAAKNATEALADKKVKDVRLQIEACRIVAPRDGLLVHAEPDPKDVVLGYGPVVAGNLVHEGQTLLWLLPDPSAADPQAGSKPPLPK